MTDIQFRAGDTLSYRSVTQGHLVVWTRAENGEWHANDENWSARGPASDGDIRFAMQENDTTYTPTAHLGADDHLHCAACATRHGIHCVYHCSLFLTETIRVMGEQNVTQRQAEDVVMRRLRAEAVARG